MRLVTKGKLLSPYQENPYFHQETVPCSECGERVTQVIVIDTVDADIHDYAGGVPQIALCRSCVWEAWRLLGGEHDVKGFYE